MIILMTTDKFSPVLPKNHFLEEYKSDFTHKPLLYSSTSLLKLNKYILNAGRTRVTGGFVFGVFFIFLINSLFIFPSSACFYIKMAVFPTLCQVLLPVNLSTDL